MPSKRGTRSKKSFNKRERRGQLLRVGLVNLAVGHGAVGSTNRRAPAAAGADGGNTPAGDAAARDAARRRPPRDAGRGPPDHGGEAPGGAGQQRQEGDPGVGPPRREPRRERDHRREGSRTARKVFREGRERVPGVGAQGRVLHVGEVRPGLHCCPEVGV
eukprot:9467665-Pyramimonas_sp.AAC.1